MAIRQVDVPAELQAAAEMLCVRWTLALPTAIASLALATAISFGGVMRSPPVMVVGLALVVGSAQSVVVAAAEDAWKGGSADLRHALRRTVAKAPTLLALFTLVVLLALIPFSLSFVLIGTPLILVLAFVLMFALPAAIVGGESASGAIAASFRLTRAHLTPGLAAFVAILVAMALGRIVSGALLRIPFVGVYATFVVGGFTSAYAALVAVRFYELLRERPEDRLSADASDFSHFPGR